MAKKMWNSRFNFAKNLKYWDIESQGHSTHLDNIDAQSRNPKIKIDFETNEINASIIFSSL